MVEDGWNWSDIKANGKQLGFTLCPDHSTDELIDEHTEQMKQRIAEENGEEEGDSTE